MKKYAIIVAGGSGLRMGAAISKQYLSIGGQPILMRTISKFYHHDEKVEVILVIPQKDFDYWRQLCEEHHFHIPHQLVAGGASRFQSVKNGLLSIPDSQGLVAIHDGVRPFVSEKVIAEGYLQAAKTGSAVAVVPLKDSLRRISTQGSVFQNREEFRLVQTPQTFQLDRIKKAFDVNESSAFTDDATVYEFHGWEVTLYDGDLSNIKITTPDDMVYAEFLLKSR